MHKSALEIHKIPKVETEIMSYQQKYPSFLLARGNIFPGHDRNELDIGLNPCTKLDCNLSPTALCHKLPFRKFPKSSVRQRPNYEEMKGKVNMEGWGDLHDFDG